MIRVHNNNLKSSSILQDVYECIPKVCQSRLFIISFLTLPNKLHLTNQCMPWSGIDGPLKVELVYTWPTKSVAINDQNTN